MDFPSLLVCPKFVKIEGSFVIKSIWKAWQLFTPWLRWRGNSGRRGLSLRSLNIWWSFVINLQGIPLAKVQWLHAQKFSKRGISNIADFYFVDTNDWIPWPRFRQLFNLNCSDKETYDEVVEVIPFTMWQKCNWQIQKPWWKDWSWYPNIPFMNFSAKLGCRWLSPHLPMVPKLISRWNEQGCNANWKAQFQAVWARYLEPKQSFLLGPSWIRAFLWGRD